jgi:hydrogenase nickel incorporation protein HypB
MCDTCGCGSGTHSHDHEHSNKLIEMHENIMSNNDNYATNNRNYFAKQDIFVLNLVSSPGSGKTTLLEKTIKAISHEYPIFVIEGDQQTELDADRIRNSGAKALQINTGAGCHLDAHQIAHAVEEIKPENNSILMIENVGNLVCPSMFDLGEHHKVAILSVTEGEDKPLKYPHMFHASDIVIFNKIDLLPYVDFNIERSIEYVKRLNPNMKIFTLSATTGEGMDKWLIWLKSNIK